MIRFRKNNGSSSFLVHYNIALFVLLLCCTWNFGHDQTLDAVQPKQYHTQPFTHPGLLHSSEDLKRMQQMVSSGREPWKSAFEKFRSHPCSSASWKPHPSAHVERSLLDGAGKNISALEKDVCAAY